MIEEILDILFPPFCNVCKKKTVNRFLLCNCCLTIVRKITSPLCTVCGLPFEVREGQDHKCSACLKSLFTFSSARSIAEYDVPVMTLLHKLKYNYDTSVDKSLLKIAETFDFSGYEECELILPIPLYVSRLKQRGVNQAFHLAKLFFENRGEDIHNNILVRVNNTVSQTSLSGSERKKNVKGAFKVKNTEVIENKRICLVDDVFTTGATVNECSRCLMSAGAAEVRVLTFARVRLR